MEFFARHGCLAQERTDGNLFRVDLRCRCEVGAAAESDELRDTLDYAALYDLVAAEMLIPSNLLEHVAGRILKAVTEHCPGMEWCAVRVAKKNPPVAGHADWSAVELTWEGQTA